MCAPVARTARARDQDRKFRSASTSMPGPRQCSRSRARDCSPAVYGPSAAPSRLPVPDSAAATHRACGNAPSREAFEGRPKYAAFFSLSGTSGVDPSIEATRSPQQNTPGAPAPPVGPATCSNSIRTGSEPSFPRPRDSEEMFGCLHRLPCPASNRRPDPAGRPAGQRRAAGSTGRPPASASPARTRSSGPGTATAPRRSTPSAGPAAASGAAPGSPSPQRPHRPGPAGTPWSVPRSRSGPAATRPATDPQHHHEPQNGYITTSDLKARPLSYDRWGIYTADWRKSGSCRCGPIRSKHSLGLIGGPASESRETLARGRRGDWLLGVLARPSRRCDVRQNGCFCGVRDRG